MAHISLEVYSMGVVYASVCARADMTQEEVEDLMNRLHPSGVESRWKVSPEKFRTGEDNPSLCNQDPARRHYLMNC